MLDQLVAFCGETIAEHDVLNVFGFTSEQTVASFTEKILSGGTAEALELLHTEAEAGKDMMKLMSDLIGYLRDLLVFKVKPDAVADELNPELQSALSAHAAVIETDRLLELIDQFAGAEGRMKWAPNKKLHFEVAVIKAIQTLGQVTLNEVIENLSALREGKAIPESKSQKQAPPTPAKLAPRSVAAAPAQPVLKPASAPVVAEKPRAEEQKAAPAELIEFASSSGESDAIDLDALWQNAVAQIRARRPLIKGWVESAKVLGNEGRSFLLGFPPEQKTAMESIAMPRNRDFLEALLKEISGRDWSVKFSLKEGLLVQAPKLEEKEEAPAPAPERKAAEVAASFTNDPLIREALEIFKGEIKPVTE
jgi:DNA polymerase-3 subunit gamma/tau